MSKQFWGVIVVIILIFVGIFAFSGKKDNGQKADAGANLTQHTDGKGTTGVALVEYGDYQCPFCQQYYATIKNVQAEFGDQIKFQFRNFPLTSLHRNAFAAARAAEAADLQGKFWQMHDLLYTTSNWQVWTQTSSPDKYFEQYARQLGLNEARFKADYASTTVNDRINADMGEGNRLGITGTPTFFIDGKKVEIANSQNAFEEVIKAAIDQKSQSSNKPN